MPNKTDKELIDEFRAKLDMSMIQLKENRNETFWKDHVLVDLLKQALKRKEEDIAQRYEAERFGAIVILKELCEDFGDLDWDEDLHLVDIIEKHLARHLWQLQEEIKELKSNQ